MPRTRFSTSPLGDLSVASTSPGPDSDVSTITSAGLPIWMPIPSCAPLPVMPDPDTATFEMSVASNEYGSSEVGSSSNVAEIL